MEKMEVIITGTYRVVKLERRTLKFKT